MFKIVKNHFGNELFRRLYIISIDYFLILEKKNGCTGTSRMNFGEHYFGN